MAPPKLSLLVVLLVLLLPAAGNAADAPPVGGGFNVTEMLGKFPEFTLFNYLMAKTRVAKDINNRTSITVLAPVNADVDWLLRRSARLPRAALLELLSVHVVLDYYDAAKLVALPRGRGAKPVLATTLYQTFGPANGDKSGFLTITPAPDGGAVFASAAPGAIVNATFKKAVIARPYNISILQISNFVVPPGVITRPRAPPPPKKMSSVAAVAPSPAPVPSPSALPCPPVTMPIEEPMEEVPAAAPAPSSQGYAVKAKMSWWSGAGVALGMACVLAHL
ncbi:fasciclin-like arabinogalactan protein 14 [Hordeum vulgare subsp. vulgare]|uniref:FAS1 domain-containing protein n=1 Tax=Hordeum vulgare subsp. vulgare TaxID=112509 RepID=A0A8I7BFJ1_HORVV|nr:fasciclin-like arabinogalactan protein 14 [Hordeum vulgare subsp. vulgare]